MLKKLMTMSFGLVLVAFLSMTVCAQEGSKQASDQKTDQKQAGKGAKQERLEGVVVRNSKDKSNLTVRKQGSTVEKTVYYDDSTKWVSQEHGSKTVNDIDASQVKDGDRVIVKGTYKEKGQFHATLISKRLTPQH